MTNEVVGVIRPDEYPMRATFEHIVPKAFGGVDDPSNICMVHSACNAWRGVHNFDDYRDSYGQRLYEWFKDGFDLCSRPALPDPQMPIMRAPSISVRVVA